MSETIIKAKQLIADGKFPFIIDTMAEFDDFSLGKELGVGKFGLFHVSTYETCKHILSKLLEGTPREKLGECAVVISNLRALAGERYLELSMSDGQPTVEIEVPGEPGEEPEKVEIAEITREAFIQRRLFKGLLMEIKSARAAGLDIVVVEGETETPKEAYMRMCLDAISKNAEIPHQIKTIMGV